MPDLRQAGQLLHRFQHRTSGFQATGDVRMCGILAEVDPETGRALNVERINSLVYAVVMESRGIYMSTDAAVVKKYGEGLLKFNDQILTVVKNWESIVGGRSSDRGAMPLVFVVSIVQLWPARTWSP